MGSTVGAILELPRGFKLVDFASSHLRTLHHGRHFIGRAIHACEMPCTFKAASNRDLDNGHFCLDQQVSRPLQPHVHEVFLGRRIEVFAEQPFQLTGGNPQLTGDLGWRTGIVQPCGHDRYRRRQMLVSHPVSGLK